MPSSLQMKTMSGIGVSDGIVIGEAYVIGARSPRVYEMDIDEVDIENETIRFKNALLLTKNQIKELQEDVYQTLGKGESDIFEAHLMLVDDKVVVEEVLNNLKLKKKNVEYIFNEVLQKYIDAISLINDPYFKDRIVDIRDVADRILANLSGKQLENITDLSAPRIIFAHDISPFDAARMDKTNVIGFATDVGSKTSHTAIIARSMEIPAIAGLHSALKYVKTGDKIILDGANGKLIINPSKTLLEKYRVLEIKECRRNSELEIQSSLPTETLDGFRIKLAANIEHPEDIQAIKKFNTVGVGLYRTEYMFIRRSALPTEEEQFQAYKAVAEGLSPNAVIIRTLDLGGDKIPIDGGFNEENPFLGVRAIRFSLMKQDIFITQLRAILRASHYGKVRLMFPMIAAVEELLEALELLEQVKEDFIREGIPFNSKDMDIGIMIEVPSAALIADQLANYVDFFSIGTNDLIQYLLAVDRVNENVAYLYQPTHPSIIRLIRYVTRAAQAKGKWVGICGEMAGDPILTPLILGLGIVEMSMSPVVIPKIKNVIRSMKMHEAEKLVEDAIKCSTGTEVVMLCNTFARKLKEANS